MAGDWIKMRPSLLTHPKVNGIARIIENDGRAARSLLQPQYCGATNGATRGASEYVTRGAIRGATIAALLAVWGAANEHTSDGIFVNTDLSDIDDIAGMGGFGAAMVAVGWAVFDTHEMTVTLPNFNEYNTPGRERVSKHAERQRRYLANKASRGATDGASCGATNGAKNDGREEKRREEKNKKETSKESPPEEPDPAIAPEAEIDWLTVEAEFVTRWNATPGVATCSRGVPANLRDEFREAWLSSGWIERVRLALAKFPLRNGVRMSLKKFLLPSTIDEILGGVHDWERNDTAGRGAEMRDITRGCDPANDADYARFS